MTSYRPVSYHDVILTCVISLLNIGYVSNETNEDVHMYIEEFILDDLHYLMYKLELRYYVENTLAFIQSQQYLELSEKCS